MKGYFFKIISDNSKAREKEMELFQISQQVDQILGKSPLSYESFRLKYVNFAKIEGKIVSYDLMSGDEDLTTGKLRSFEEAWEANAIFAGGEANLEYLGFGEYSHNEALNLESVLR